MLDFKREGKSLDIRVENTAIKLSEFRVLSTRHRAQTTTLLLRFVNRRHFRLWKSTEMRKQTQPLGRHKVVGYSHTNAADGAGDGRDNARKGPYAR